jgi:DNA topoisomerase-2
MEDNIKVEPVLYAPIIPTILINGKIGIGTGFSTKIPPYNPKDIIINIRNLLNNKEFIPMDPWWQGFNGIVKKIDNYNYEIYGNWHIKNSKLIITELPVGEATYNYKEFLEKMLEDDSKKNKDDKKKVKKKDDSLISYKDNNTDVDVYFELIFEDDYLENLNTEDINKIYHLCKKYSITNMHLYNPNGHIKKYDNVEEIMKDYFYVRLDLYQKRKDYQLNILEYQLKLISFKVKFILNVIDKKIDVNNKKKIEIEEKLEELEFPKFGKNKDDTKLSYDYLLTMPIHNLSFEKVEEFKKSELDKQTEYNELKDMSIKEIWLNELDLLEKKYNKWMNNKLNNDVPKIKKKLIKNK